MNRRQCSSSAVPRCSCAGVSRPPVCRAGRRAAVSAGVPARRLRFDQSPDSLFEQLLLRGAARTSRSRNPIRHRTPARWRWMPTGRWRRRCATSIGAHVSAAAGRLHAICGHGRFVAQPLRNPGQHRTGATLGGTRDYRSGFLGRLSETLIGPAPSVRRLPSPTRCRWRFEGGATVPNLSLKSVGKPPFDERQARILSDMYAGHHLEAAVEQWPGAAPGGGAGDGRRDDRGQSQCDQHQGIRTGSRAHGSADARQVSDRIHRCRRLGHACREGAAAGAAGHQSWPAWGAACRYSSQSLGAEWNNTVVVVLSEFGRTFRENGNRGTDHGHGTVYWVLGGAINGGSDRRRAAARAAEYPVSRPGLSGAQRLSRRARRLVSLAVGSLAGSKLARLRAGAVG